MIIRVQHGIYLFCLSLVLVGCTSDTDRNLDNLSAIKANFISSIYESYVDEGPFHMTYYLRTILFSENLISLFGEVIVYDHLPHGWSRFESKTYIRHDGIFKELALSDLFPSPSQKKWLREHCENSLKHECDQSNYFNGSEPPHDHLDSNYINLFVIDHESLIVLFQPYTVGGLGDGPFTVRIPFAELLGRWQVGNPLEKQLPIVKNFISSWDSNNWISEVSEDHSIAFTQSLDFRGAAASLPSIEEIEREKSTKP